MQQLTKFKQFQIKPQKFKIWDNQINWKINNIEKYPSELREEFDQLQKIIIEFVKSDYSESVCEKYERKYSFIRKLAYWVSRLESFFEAYLTVNTYRGYYGLLIASTNAKISFEQLEKTKQNIDWRHYVLKDNRLLNALQQKYWTKYGVENVSDFMNFSLGKINVRLRGYYLNRLGLERAIEEIKEEYVHLKTKGRTLTAKHVLVNYRGIVRVICSGNWVKYGIRKYSWFDFRKKVLEKEDCTQNSSHCYSGLKGLIKALVKVSELKHDLELQMVELLCTDVKFVYPEIINMLKTENWMKYGVKKYDWRSFIKLVQIPQILNELTGIFHTDFSINIGKI